MANRDQDVIDAFVRIWSAWWASVPTGLARQDSSLVLRLLTLGLGEGGVSQSELKRQLGIAQPRLSKLMRKLEKVGWIKVNRSKVDRRIKLMTTTVTAQAWMASLKQDLGTLLRAQRVGQVRSPGRKPKVPATRRHLERQGQPMGFVFEE